MRKVYWTDSDLIWNNNPYYWNHVIEITAVQEERRVVGAFVRMNSPRRIPNKKELRLYPKKLKKIKLICVVEDEIFEQENYINKMLKVEMEDYVITEVRKLDLSPNDASWNLKHASKGKFRVEIKNVVIK